MNSKIQMNGQKKQIIGYALGDFGSCLLFGLVQSVLQKYYTDILKINVISIMTMMVVARIWDAANDIICGHIVDANPFHSTDKYRVWIKFFAIPVAISSVLMFVYIPGLSSGGYLAFAYVTYILFGMLYTCVNIPYGTLAYSMGQNGHSNTKLSIARSVGSVFGALPAMLLISFSYVVVNDRKVMSYEKVTIGVLVIAVVSAVVLKLTHRLTKEQNLSAIIEDKRSEMPNTHADSKKLSRSVFILFRSRPYLSVCLAGMLFLAAQMYEQAYNSYLFDYYFQQPQLTMLPTICQYLPAGIMILFVPRLTNRFKTKQICAVGLFFAGVCNLVLFAFFPQNITIYIIFHFLGGFGTASIFLLLWALLNETFKYNETNYAYFDHSTAYAIFLFMRKIGQSIEAVLVNTSLNRIGYVENVLNVKNLSLETLQSMFRDSVLIPAFLFVAAAIILSIKWDTSH